ncbi:hypothetical protein [Herbidospora mongoliensis]|uniref:hypothetical protein n=1 Tax=Herbidospora mongoliensis TaxID=688067 RepID=UPI000A46BF38|nr:hypothetical protein [Herbidospora mongoliensis]
MNGEEIDERLAARFNVIGGPAQNAMEAREFPADKPFGGLVLSREDIGVDEVFYTLTSAGLHVPVPRKLITQRLIDQITVTGLERMKWYSAPKER